MTYYDILEVSQNASEEVIHMAYKALCKKYHPDVFMGDKATAEEYTKGINEAYAVLSDAAKRKEYDDFLRGKKNVEQHTDAAQPPQEAKEEEHEAWSNPNKKSFLVGLLLTVLLIGIIIAALLVSGVFSANDNASDSQSISSSLTAGEWIEQEHEKEKEKSDFLDKNIVFVIDGDEIRYYTYDQMMSTIALGEEVSFCAYNKEQAIGIGYVACDNIDVETGWSAEKADFLDEYIVFVIDGFGDYYYTYDEMIAATSQMDEYSYWAYNEELARAEGYLPKGYAGSNNEPSSVTPSISQDSGGYKRTCLSVGCDNIPSGISLYCGEHVCAKNNCSSERTYSSSFCSRHTCDSTGCYNGSNDYGYYCSEHACAESGCGQERTFRGSYCSWHECNEVGCGNKKKNYGSYCSEHTCAQSGCTSGKAVLSDYCYIHG